MKHFSLALCGLMLLDLVAAHPLEIEAELARLVEKSEAKKLLQTSATQSKTRNAVLKASFTQPTIVHHQSPSELRQFSPSGLNSFEKGKDGGSPSECDKKYHSDKIPIVALSAGWFSKKARCFHNITFRGHGCSVVAGVVDDCDSTMGRDEPHDYQPPCDNNIVDASKTVWEALGVPKHNRGTLDITWSEI